MNSVLQASELLASTLGQRAASILFALALLASGQNSTLTGTMAGQVSAMILEATNVKLSCVGQVVMEGFLDIRLRPELRRIVTRAIAIVPSIIAVGAGTPGCAF